MGKRTKLAHEQTATDREASLATAAREARWALDDLADRLRLAGRPIPAWITAAASESLKIQDDAEREWDRLTAAEKCA